MNILATKKVIDLCKRMKHLEAFIHVSTAYANCNRRYVSELVYNPPVHPERIIEATEWISEELAHHITPSIIKPRPNTYTYTKAIAETVVMQECLGQLPTAIVRPSIVGASWKEPFPGWIDNFNGPTALFAAIGKGILRTMIGNGNSTADIIPVDFPVNMMIVAAYVNTYLISVLKLFKSLIYLYSSWATAMKKGSNSKEISVYNSTTGQINKLTWGMVEVLAKESLAKNPLENIFLVPNPSFTPNRYFKIAYTHKKYSTVSN
jgi:fatty acyl-CoA reductase